MYDLEVIAERLKTIIKSQGGYDKVAEKIDVNRQTLIRVATGKTDPKLSLVMKIVGISGHTLDEVLYEEFAIPLKQLKEAERETAHHSTINDLLFDMREHMNKKQQKSEAHMETRLFAMLSDHEEKINQEINMLKERLDRLEGQQS
ncbi:helix-turn-helix transcriptional regulator [Vibrio fluvialis]|uniref:hypothetical protein n=1 Tax=Vibrio fluvialis TaxID=676 RepID=UPI003D7E050A